MESILGGVRNRKLLGRSRRMSVMVLGGCGGWEG